MREKRVSVSGITADDDGIAAAQAAADNQSLIAAITAAYMFNQALTLNGTLVSGGIAVLEKPSKITITSGADASGIVFTIRGRNALGNVVEELLTGPNNTTVTGLVEFKIVDSVTPNVSGTVDLNIGCYPLELRLASFPVILATPRRVSITSADDLSGVSFTVEGTNRAGTAISETIDGPNADTVETEKVFKTVTAIRTDADLANDAEAGWGTYAVSAPIVPNWHGNPFSIGLVADVTGTATYTVEHTLEDVFDPDWNEGEAEWLPSAFAENETADADGNYAFAVAAFRLRVSAGNGTVDLYARQAGFRGD